MPKEPDMVNKPQHYTAHPSGVECFDITEHMTFCVGSAMKYLWRGGLKVQSGSALEAQIEDYEKAIVYIRREINRIQLGTDPAPAEVVRKHHWIPTEQGTMCEYCGVSIVHDSDECHPDQPDTVPTAIVRKHSWIRLAGYDTCLNCGVTSTNEECQDE